MSDYETCLNCNAILSTQPSEPHVCNEISKEAANVALMAKLDEEIDKRVAEAVLKIFQSIVFLDNGRMASQEILHAMSYNPDVKLLMESSEVRRSLQKVIADKLSL